jgi:hypothetical protein
MNGLQFVASIISALAWPIAVAVVVWVFRVELRQKLGNVRRASGIGMNFEFADQVENVEKAGLAVEMEQVDALPDAKLDPSLAHLIKSFPEMAILQQFKAVERTLLMIRKVLPDDKPHRNLNEVINKLAEQKLISENVAILFQRVRLARNTIAHANEAEKMAQGEAIELVGQIRTLQTIFDRVYQELSVQRQ